MKSAPRFQRSKANSIRTFQCFELLTFYKLINFDVLIWTVISQKVKLDFLVIAEEYDKISSMGSVTILVH